MRRLRLLTCCLGMMLCFFFFIGFLGIKNFFKLVAYLI